jgi:isopenicillin N synthase-like dioxygenase
MHLVASLRTADTLYSGKNISLKTSSPDQDWLAEMPADALPEIPRISLSSSTPQEVLQALSTVGFIHLELDGTGIPQTDIDRAFELSRLIYSVPHEERQRFWQDGFGNGYFGMKNSLDERTTKADLKETFTWGRYEACEGQSETSQVLPPSIQHYRNEMIEFDGKCFEASLKVLDILSEAFEVRQLPLLMKISSHLIASSRLLPVHAQSLGLECAHISELPRHA